MATVDFVWETSQPSPTLQSAMFFKDLSGNIVFAFLYHDGSNWMVLPHGQAPQTLSSFWQTGMEWLKQA